VTDDDVLDLATRIVVAFDDLWRSGLHRTHDPRCCILAARLAIELLREHGVRAWAEATNTVIFNRAGWELAEREVPHDQWPEHAWSVGATEDAEGSGFPGHVWAAADGWLIDLSARQFHRPVRIHVDGGLIVRNRLGEPARPMVLGEGPTMLVIGVGRLSTRSYRQARDWSTNWRELVAPMRELIAAQESS
jgi:hypothetical protein